MWLEIPLVMSTFLPTPLSRSFESSDIVFNLAVNLTSEKWDATLAAGKNNQRAYLLTLKIRFGVSKYFANSSRYLCS